VNEVNTAPVFLYPTNSTVTNIFEQVPFAMQAVATDADIPTNTLTFAFVSATNLAGQAVANLTVSTNGLISWTPTEAQGPSTNIVLVSVTDTNLYALTNQSYSVTNSFTIIVLESNSAPFWTNGFANVTMNELTALSITNPATDLDLPTNTLTYALSNNAPAWAGIDTNTGVITLLPGEADAPTNVVITVIVTDNGSPNLSGTTNFTVIVNEVNTAPHFILTPPDVTVAVSNTLVITNGATDSDIPTNTLVYSLLNPPAGAVVDTNSGVLTLTLNVGTNKITTVVTDNGVPPLSATNSFTVIVTNNLTVPTNLILISSIIQTNINGTNGFLLTWFAPTNNHFRVQWTPELEPPAWSTFTNPPLVAYDLFISPTNSRFTFFDDGTQTGGFGPDRFYRLLLVPPPTNTPPFFVTPPATMFVTPLSTLTVTNPAGDADLPPQILSFNFSTTVAGGNVPVLNTNTGIITWTPDLSQAGTTNTITTIVTDNGSPNLSATNSFLIIVNPVPAFSSASSVTNGVNLLWLGSTNEKFQVRWTADLAPPSWSLFPDVITSTNGIFTFVDTNAPLLMKFYQLLLLP
jgi:hypothetical protein